jgi:hypothetical protein
VESLVEEGAPLEGEATRARGAVGRGGGLMCMGWEDKDGWSPLMVATVCDTLPVCCSPG